VKEFVPSVIRDRASAAEGLCIWCLAMNNFSAVYKKVEPKR